MVRFPPAPPFWAPKWAIWYPGVPIEWCLLMWVRQPEGSFMAPSYRPRSPRAPAVCHPELLGRNGWDFA